MVVGAVLLLGAVSLLGLPLDLLPELNLPVAVAVADFPGAAPAEVEELLTRPLEEALVTVPRLEHISSYSRPGGTFIILQFDWGTSMDFALLDAREKLDLVQPFLPEEASSPRLIQADPNLFPVMQILIHGSDSPVALRRAAEETVKPRLERLAGVAVADVLGGAREEVHVTVDPMELLLYGLAPGHLALVLGSAGLDLAAGPLREGERERLVRSSGRVGSLQDLRDLPLLPLEQGVLTLGEIAAVDFQETEAGGISRFNGRPSVTIAVRKQSGANTVAVAGSIRRILDSLEADLPPGMALQVVSDQSSFIRESLRNVLEVGVTGGLLAALVLLLFLKSPAATVAVLLSIPVSIVATFVLMFFSGLTINIISLGGLALGLGIMVDNSIVVLENIYRLHQEGAERVKAAVQGSSQVAGALLAATLTTVVVFLPVLFLEGVVSQIFNPLALTVSFALLTSLLVSLTLVPLFASRFLPAANPGEAIAPIPPPETGPIKSPDRTASPASPHPGARSYARLYRSALHRTLDRPWPLFSLVLLLLGASLYFLPRIGSEFLPPIDEGMVNITMELPADASLSLTRARAAALEAKILEVPGVESVKTAAGTGASLGMEGFGSLAANQARLEALLASPGERQASARETADLIRDRLKAEEGAVFKVEESRQSSGGGFMENPVSIALRGSDLQVLEDLSSEIARIVARVPGTREVTSSFQKRRPEVVATLQREAALRRGVSPLEVAAYLRTALQGQQVGRLVSAAGERNIYLKVEAHRCDSLAALESLPFIPASALPGTTASPYPAAAPAVFPAAATPAAATPAAAAASATSAAALPPATRSVPAPFPVRLGELMEFTEVEGPLAIRRSDQVRSAHIEAQVSGRDAGSVIADIRQELAALELPYGYSLDYEGEQRLMEESFSDLRLALLLSLFLVYMLMAAQFESLRQPFVIMFTLPLALTGILGSLLLSGRPFSVPVYIGIIMLAGIVVNNGIVMLDHINRLRRQGTALREAVLEGARVRLRPILMTSLTTLLAMVPLALGLGSGAEIQAPLAVVVAGGLFTSTLLTLFVVPALYYLLERRWQHD
jgi:hydrophobic/amphiphilic exporter-1 (mainly G- bacteria), HAE1 family